MLKSRAFEAVTISFSLLNSPRYHEVLRTAHELGIGVAAMNPLGGGIIPNNADFFSFAKSDDGEAVTEAALRYVLAHEPIQIALSGPPRFRVTQILCSVRPWFLLLSLSFGRKKDRNGLKWQLRSFVVLIVFLYFVVRRGRYRAHSAPVPFAPP